MRTHPPISSSWRSLPLLALLPSLACSDDVGGATAGQASSSSGSTSDAVTASNGNTQADDATETVTPPGGTTSPDATTDDPDTSAGSEGSSGTTGDPPADDTIPSVVAELVALENAGTDVPGFPLEYAPASGDLRVIPQLEPTVTAAFLDPLTSNATPPAPAWGANNDFNAFLGDGWERDSGTPYYSGSGNAGWMWTNFEYIGNDRAAVGAAPTGMGLQMVQMLAAAGVADFQFDVTDSAQWDAAAVDAYILWHKRAVGGALYRAERDASGWAIDAAADNVRFDATSDTLVRITGPVDVGTALDDDGNALPPNVVPGTSSNCSGGVTPWGTIITAEENTQFAYGNLESCWTSANAFNPGGVCPPGGNITWNTNPSPSSDFNRGTANNTRPHFYGYLVEIDPAADPSVAYDPATGDGHQKLGALGRARWENATFHVGPDWRLVPGQPIVLYAADDTRGGRIYKWVSQGDYAPGMSKAEIRNLLTEGRVYAAHFADLDNSDGDGGELGGVTVNGVLPSAAAPGQGQWILLSTTNDADVAPNAGTAAGAAGTTVGDALQDVTWNGMGGFPDEQTLLFGLYTASNKLGIRELNRPEDLEWNPLDGTLWIAFTNHDRPNALRDDGSLSVDDPITPANERDAFVRSDTTGSIMVLVEADPADPAASATFTFHTAWRGTDGTGTFDAGNPDNLVLDAAGGVWFGTDGYFSPERQDAIYYLEVAADPAESRAWRIAAVPSDAEATGPMLTPDQQSLFLNVQHPQEALADAPASDFADAGHGARSGQVVLTLVPR